MRAKINGRVVEGIEGKKKGAWKLTARAEEGLQEGSGFFGEKAARNFHLMIQFRAGKQLEAGTESAALGVVGGIDKARNARLDERTGAHGARLECDVQNGAGKAVVAKEARGFAKNDDFGVCGRVIIANGAIA